MLVRSRVWMPYALAVVAVAAAALVHGALGPVWSGRVPFVLFYPAVVFVAWFAGRGPGLLATVLSIGAITRVWSITHAVAPAGHAIALVFFAGVGVTVSLLVAARDRARDSVDLLLHHTPL